MTRIAAISHSRDGYAVELAEVPLRWLVADRAAEALLYATGHVMCCRTPGWAYVVRWGPRDEEYGLADRSLGHLLYLAGQRLALLSSRHETRRVLIPVTAEWVGEHYPEIRADLSFLEGGASADAMTVKFSADDVCPKCGTRGCLDDAALDW